ncbi:MAG: transcription antitermination factor NusB [Bacteroidetes bacterium]|nr:MAG: transcription antitermination factor NusB [Bacteroidota bacterium]
MLSRRYIRIKVMQALYAYFHSEDKSILKHEKELFGSFERIYDLYLYLILLLTEIRHCGRNRITIRKAKQLPRQEDINPNTKFVENKIIGILATNRRVAAESSKRKLVWDKDSEIPQKLFAKITESEEYSAYLSTPAHDFKEDKKFISTLYRNCIAGDESLEMFFEEKNIHWADDIDFVNTLVLKTIELIPESATDNLPIAQLYKDEKEDKQFAKDLFKRVIEHSDAADSMIRAKTENWELERIAFMDVLLMKMAIVEFLYFPTVPVKVSLNEYIELAKQYSTPKSSVFINGILDKLLAEFKGDGRLQKEGRGLVEN